MWALPTPARRFLPSLRTQLLQLPEMNHHLGPESHCRWSREPASISPLIPRKQWEHPAQSAEAAALALVLHQPKTTQSHQQWCVRFCFLMEINWQIQSNCKVAQAKHSFSPFFPGRGALLPAAPALAKPLPCSQIPTQQPVPQTQMGLLRGGICHHLHPPV